MMQKPTPLNEIDKEKLKALFEICKSYITSLDEKGYINDEDYEAYEASVFEEALEMIYGASVFDWVNHNNK